MRVAATERSRQLSEEHSAQAAHLVRRAIKVFETDRTAAWRYLNDASTLLVTGSGEACNDSLLTRNAPRRSGLANWQAKRALAYIEANLASRFTSRALAELVNLSEGHFSRAFKRSVGFSPRVYISRRRVERAKLMLASSRQCLADIAVVCGFTDQSHLTRYFRRLVGTSPGAWRRVWRR